VQWYWRNGCCIIIIIAIVVTIVVAVVIVVITSSVGSICIIVICVVVVLQGFIMGLSILVALLGLFMAAEFVVFTVIMDDDCGSGMLVVVADWCIFIKSSKNRFHWAEVHLMLWQSVARLTSSAGDCCSLWLGVVSIIINDDAV